MNWLREVARRLRMLVHRRQFDADLEEEMQLHLELRQQEHLESGMTADSARAAARRQFGNVTALREKSHMAWGWEWFENLVQDVRDGLRMLRKNPGFTSVAILTLALGIGANTAIFSVINGVLLSPLPYKNPQQLYRIREIVPQMAKSYPLLDANLQDFLIWQKGCHAFSQIAIAESTSVIYTGDGPAEEIYGLRASATLLDVLGIRPQQGRAFFPEEDLAGHGNVTLITDEFWQERFQRDRAVIGRKITLDGEPNTIVGVLPAFFRFPKELSGSSRRLDFYKPIGGPRFYEEPLIGEFDFVAIARLRQGVTPNKALAELNVMQEQIAAQAKADSGGMDLRTQLFPLADEIVGPSRRGLLLLLAAVGAVLLIVCVNLANLFLSRAPARMREAAIRTALGASRSRLVRQMLIESVLLALLGGLLGVGVASFAVQWLVHAASGVPRIDEVTINSSVLAFALCLSAFTGVIFGVLPALTIAKAEPQPVLKSIGTTSTESVRTRRLRGTLVGFEVGLCTMLLILAGLLSSSLFRLARVNIGFSVSDVVAADIDLPEQTYATPAARQAFYERALAKIRELPAVRSAAWISLLPLAGQGSVTDISLVGEQVRPGQQIIANYRAVSSGYFSTMRIPLVRGRPFTDNDRGRRLVILSQSLAEKLWPSLDPIGKQCIAGWGQLQIQPSEVVGVVGDIRTAKLDQPPLNMVYVPDSWGQKVPGAPAFASIVVSSATDSNAIAPSVRDVLQGINPNVPIVAVRPMTQLISDNLQARRFQLLIAAFFAVSALLLASLGIFGVVAYSVEQRRQELGVRCALGAQQAQLLSLVLRQGMTPVLAGMLAGAAAAFAGGNLIQSLLYDMRAFDPLTFGGVLALVGAVALLACYVPARRTLRVDPILALRYE